MKGFNLIILGPQGSGKGTQAKILAKKLKLRHLSSGEVLREVAKTPTPLGHYLRYQLTTGSLTPISKLLLVFEQYVKKIPQSLGLILDGFARQITETKILLRKLKKLKRPIDLALLINITAAETIRRLSKRGQCDRCHRIFILGNRLKIGDECPRCNGVIFQREDDKPVAIRKRLALYCKRTLPVIRYFKKLGLLEKINGEQSIEKVHQDILRILRKRKLVG